MDKINKKIKLVDTQLLNDNYMIICLYIYKYIYENL